MRFIYYIIGVAWIFLWYLEHWVEFFTKYPATKAPKIIFSSRFIQQNVVVGTFIIFAKYFSSQCAKLHKIKISLIRITWELV